MPAMFQTGSQFNYIIMRLSFRPILFLVCAVALTQATMHVYAQQTVGLFTYDQARSLNGLTLFTPISSTQTYLIDNCGRVVHTWGSTYRPGQSVYLTNDGSILRSGNPPNRRFTSGGVGGLIERIAWDGTLTWSYTVSNDTTCQHHDIHPMPNGNVLLIAWVRRTRDQALAAGRRTLDTGMWTERVQEVQPTGATTGRVVWQWDLWDHLVQDADTAKPHYGAVNQHPERMNINYGQLLPGKSEDWVHMNGIDYNPELDQIIVSAHNPSEIWIIDHSTTTAQAATGTGGKYGKGGDFLFRWGNPAVYNAGTPADQKLYGQHNPQWIGKGLADAGNIMIFNNGANARAYSSVDIIAPPLNPDGTYALAGNRYKPDSAYWQYTGTPPASFYGMNISGAQRLSNGNTLICRGPGGEFFEITPDKQIVWRYISPVSQTGPVAQGTPATNNMVFRCTRYPYDHPAFSGRTLTPGAPIERNPLPSPCDQTGVQEQSSASGGISLRMIPNPATGRTAELRLALPRRAHVTVELFDVSGVLLRRLVQQEMTAGEHVCSVNLGGLPAGSYTLRMTAGSFTTVQRVLVY